MTVYVCKNKCGIVSTTNVHACEKCGSKDWIEDKTRKEVV